MITTENEISILNSTTLLVCAISFRYLEKGQILFFPSPAMGFFLTLDGNQLKRKISLNSKLWRKQWKITSLSFWKSYVNSQIIKRRKLVKSHDCLYPEWNFIFFFKSFHFKQGKIATTSV